VRQVDDKSAENEDKYFLEFLMEEDFLFELNFNFEDH
jgi:hypothetical protein